MLSQGSGENNDIPGHGPGPRDLLTMGNEADAGGIEADPVYPALRHDFSIAGDNGDTCPHRGLGHGTDDCVQRRHREPFLDDHSETQGQRHRAPHGEIVDRTVDGKHADIPTRKKYRIAHIAVGGKSDTAGMFLK